MDIKPYLKLFIKRKNPNFVSESERNEVDWSHYYQLNIDIPDINFIGRIENVDGEKVIISFPEGGGRVQKEFDIKTLKPEYFSGLFIYKKSQLNFNSLRDIAPAKRWFFQIKTLFNNLKYSIEKRRFSAQEHKVKELLAFLEAVMEIHMRPGVNNVTKYGLLELLHGKFWKVHPDREKIEKDIQLYMEAFVSTGELVKVPDLMNNFTPTGKLVLTIEKYSVEKIRYNEMKKMQQRMVWTAIFSFVAAAISAYAAIVKPG